MKLHRFYVNDVRDKNGHLVLGHEIWINDQGLLNQWLKVLRFQVGNELVLFNESHEKLYKIEKIEYPNSVKLLSLTELEKKLPKRHIILCWSLLKSDKNKWIIQKATELGVREFIPLLADRCEKIGFDKERASKIAKEACEQCGRFDIPIIREPITVSHALEEFKGLDMYICEMGESANYIINEKAVLFIGPEGGWSDDEKSLFADKNIKHLNLNEFTLRAETACIVAAAKLLQ